MYITYTPDKDRYDKMTYNRCGKSGLKLPKLSLGMWQNFGANDSYANMEKMCLTAFDNGITNFDVANYYGYPYYGVTEENLGRVLKRQLSAHRNELVISTKAGFNMWQGPYGDGGSMKYLLTSIDQSLMRLGVDYIDIFYHHRFDPETPLSETAYALDKMVKQGKALYVGVSNYTSAQTKEILGYFREMKTPFIVNQPSYSILNRRVEEDGLDKLALEEGFGLAIYSPLHQGFLTDRYLNGIPKDSRMGKGHLHTDKKLDDNMIKKLNLLNDMAKDRGQSLSQMALAWVLKNEAVATVLIGASSPEQIQINLGALKKGNFSDDEISRIEEIVAK